MALLDWAGYEVEVVAVTDGESSHPNSRRITPAQLRDVRCEEALKAYRYLGIHPQRYRLGLPDRSVQEYEEALRRILEIRVHEASVLLAPLEVDGDPDHDAVGRAAAEVAAEQGIPLWRYAVWAQLHPEAAPEPNGGIPLPPEIQARKQRATSVFTSQFSPLGPLPEDRAPLPEGFREHFLEPIELLWRAG